MTRPIIVGCCIYCRETAKPLTREHVIPHGIGGRNNIVLQQASCDDCREKIHDFETYCLEKMLGAWRHRVGAPSRKHGGKRRPTHLRLTLNKRDGLTTTIQIPREQYPRVMYLPWLAPPGAVGGYDPSITHSMWVAHVNADLEENRKRYPEYEGFAAGEYNLDKFARWIAKIAHGAAVYQRGWEFVSTFQFALTGFIRGFPDPHDYIYKFVGAEPEIEPREKRTHSIRTSYVGGYKNLEFLVAYIRLFADQETPTYHVIVGAREREKRTV